MAIDKLAAAARLIRAATGNEYGEPIVTGFGTGYAEPGYGGGTYGGDVWVLGDWNDATRFDPESGTRITDTMPSRLGKALERIGVNTEWLDEWYSCNGCYRLVRCAPDSYPWRPAYVFTEDCETYCADCVRSDAESFIDVYVNDAHRCLTAWADAALLKSLGWQQFDPNADVPTTYENGWFPGMDADPEAVLAAVQTLYPTHDVVFYLDESSQFYVNFSAWIRPQRNDDDDDDQGDNGGTE